MAGMLSPSLAAVPTGLWVMIFCATTLWLGWRVVHDVDPIAQHLPHLLMSTAMVYMLIVAGWMGPMRGSATVTAGMEGMAIGAARWPLLTIVIAVLLMGDGAFTFGLKMRNVVPQRMETELALARVGEGDTPHGGQHMSPVLMAAGSSVDPITGAAVAPARGVLAPRSTMVCQLVMSFVMGYMLLSLL